MLPTRALRAVSRHKANITGFSPRALREAAARPPRYDPWEQTEAWRHTGIFSRWNRFKNALPGLGIATVAFTAYCVYEHFFLQDSHHHHPSSASSGEDHGSQQQH